MAENGMWVSGLLASKTHNTYTQDLLNCRYIKGIYSLANEGWESWGQ